MHDIALYLSLEVYIPIHNLLVILILVYLSLYDLRLHSFFNSQEKGKKTCHLDLSKKHRTPKMWDLHSLIM